MQLTCEFGVQHRSSLFPGGIKASLAQQKGNTSHAFRHVGVVTELGGEVLRNFSGGNWHGPSCTQSDS